MYCLSFWAIYAIFIINQLSAGADFQFYYDAGEQILFDPRNLYDVFGYQYMPSFAMFFAITFSLIPYLIAGYLFYTLNYIIGLFTIIELNKILKLMNLKEKKHRFIFLWIISNGYFVFNQFKWNQAKYIVLIILLFVIRQELQFRMDEKEKNLKFYLVNYSLLVFAIAIAPYFIFLLLIYLFEDIQIKSIFNQFNKKKFLIVICSFLLQNFLFIIFPSVLFDFLEGINHPIRDPKKINMLYLENLVNFSSSRMKSIILFSNITLLLITCFLILKKRLKLEYKFSFFLLAFLFIGVYSYQFHLALILFTFIILLFVPCLKKDYKGLDFLNN
ncbi:MAG: hypothetical protein ACFFAT_21440, partial [Promethearchaeota archaeon]